MPVRLFQEGYDVWLGNNRGTHASRKHIKYDADLDKEEYWTFSHSRMGVQDVPAMVKAITKVSGACQKISYVGHDIGNTQVFYGLA